MNSYPIAYFPPISYFQRLISEESIVFDVKEHYVKQTFRNRCQILTSNGVMDLSMPVIKNKGSKTPTEEIIISEQEDWRKIHWRAIESAYANAPFFDTYDREIKALIYQDEEQLVAYNLKIMQALLNFLDLPFTFEFSKSYQIDKYQFEQMLDIKPYYQVFNEKGKANFTPDLSILDLLFAEGPMARTWLKS